MRGCVDAMQESPVATIPVVSAPREWEMGNGKWEMGALDYCLCRWLTALRKLAISNVKLAIQVSADADGSCCNRSLRSLALRAA